MTNAELVALLPMLFEDALDCYESDLAQLIHDMREKSEAFDDDYIFEKLIQWTRRDSVRIMDEESCDYHTALSALWYDIPY